MWKSLRGMDIFASRCSWLKSKASLLQDIKGECKAKEGDLASLCLLLCPSLGVTWGQVSPENIWYCLNGVNSVC